MSYRKTVKSVSETVAWSLKAAAVLLVLALATPIVRAQQTAGAKPQPPAFTRPRPTPNDTLRSPEVHSGGRVTFRLYAPNAREVKLQADGVEAWCHGRGGYESQQKRSPDDTPGERCLDRRLRSDSSRRLPVHFPG